MKKLLSAFCALTACAALSAADIFDDGKMVVGQPAKDVKIENGQLVWTHAKKNLGMTISFNPVFDASKAKSLKLKLNASAAGRAIIVLASQPKDAKAFNYYSYFTDIPAGEQTLEIPLAKFQKSRNPMGWDKLTALQINYDGWELKNELGQTLSFSEIEFED